MYLKEYPFLVFTGIYFLIPLVFDYYSLYKLHKNLKKPFRRITVESTDGFLKQTDLLLKQYKQIPAENRKLIRLELETSYYGTTFFTQLVELFHKLIISIMITALTITVTVSVANLAFLKDNEQLQTDYSNWVDKVNTILKNFSSGLDLLMQISVICLILFIFFVNHTFVLNRKSNLQKKHLKFIEQAEKDG